MAKIIHRPVKRAGVGKVDSWGYGSRTTILEWPSLPGRPRHMRRGTAGGVVYPRIPGAAREDNMLPYAPDQVWGGGGVRFMTSDGRMFRPEVVDGEEVIVETCGEVDPYVGLSPCAAVIEE